MATTTVAIVFSIRKIYSKRSLVLSQFFRLQTLSFVWEFAIFAD